MGNRAKTILTYFTLIVVSLFFFFWGLVEAKAYLAPISVAVLLAMVILPVCRWFERKGLNRGWASFLSDLVILLFFVLVGGVISAQVERLVEDWPKMRQEIEPRINQVEQFIEDQTGVSIPSQSSLEQTQARLPGGGEQEQGAGSGLQQKQQSPSLIASDFQLSGSSMLSRAGGFAVDLLGALGTLLLIFVYIFFFLLYRSKFKKALVRMFPEEKRDKARQIITQSAHVSKNYLFGRLILIVILAVLYAIGLSISGVRHAVLVAILAAVITLIPIIGNIIGYSLAIALAFFSGSGLAGAIGVTATFAIAQFLEEYFLEPYIVGDKVGLNPVITIMVVILGGAIWGLLGMLVAIPMLGIAKVVFDNVPVLNPLGYLLGNEDIRDNKQDNNFFQRMKRWARSKFNPKKRS